MKKIIVLGYSGIISRGNGYYVQFVSHWTTTSEIAKKLSLLPKGATSLVSIKWKKFIAPILTIFKGKIYCIGKRFPEFEYEDDLITFVDYLNDNYYIFIDLNFYI